MPYIGLLQNGQKCCSASKWVNNGWLIWIAVVLISQSKLTSLQYKLRFLP